MSLRSKADKINGKIKEAVGVLTESEILKQQGKLDQEVGDRKEAAEAGAEKLKAKQAKAAAAEARRVEAKLEEKRAAPQARKR